MSNEEEVKALISLVAIVGLSPTQQVDYWTEQVVEAIEGLRPAGAIVLAARLQRLTLLKDQLNLALTARNATLKS